VSEEDSADSPPDLDGAPTDNAAEDPLLEPSDSGALPEVSAAEAFHQRARLAEDRLAEVLGAYRTLKGETEAYKERLTRNIERRYDQRRERLLLKFIDILDNLDRALEAAEQSYLAEALIQGLILVRTQLLQTLQEEGLERIPVLGLPYDPNFSEAVGTELVDDPDHHQVVIKDLLRGYRLNGRIARASRVVVGEYRGPREDADDLPGVPVYEAPTEPMVLPTEAVPSERGELSLEEIIARAEANEALTSDISPAAGEDAEEDQKT
jgi:molecular chaperone GrpE